MHCIALLGGFLVAVMCPGARMLLMWAYHSVACACLYLLWSQGYADVASLTECGVYAYTWCTFHLSRAARFLEAPIPYPVDVCDEDDGDEDEGECREGEYTDKEDEGDKEGERDTHSFRYTFDDYPRREDRPTTDKPVVVDDPADANDRTCVYEIMDARIFVPSRRGELRAVSIDDTPSYVLSAQSLVSEEAAEPIFRLIAGHIVALYGNDKRPRVAQLSGALVSPSHTVLFHITLSPREK